MSLRKVAAEVAAAGKILAGVLGAVLLVWLVFRVRAGLFNESVRVRPFEVSKSLAEAGFTGETLAEKLKDNLTGIDRAVKAWKARGGKQQELATSEIRGEDAALGEVKVPGIEFSPYHLADFFLTILQRPPIEVKGSLVSMPEDTIGSIKAGAHPSRIFSRRTPRGCDASCVDALVSQAAEGFYSETRPCGLELYYLITHRDECEIVARRCAKRDPVFAYNIWALCDMHRGDLHTAASRLRQALVLAAGERRRSKLEALIYNNWGNVFTAAGDHRGAIKKYEAATQADSSCAEAYFNWGLALAKLPDTKDTKAVAELYDKAIDADSSLPAPYLNRAVLLIAERKAKDAVVLLERASESIPGNAEIRYYLAWSHEKAGDKDAALAAYEGMIDLAPRDLRGYKGAADLLRGCHRFRAAREEIGREMRFAAPGEQSALGKQLADLETLGKAEASSLQVATCKQE
jgi:tetratricopeptide (TPR) repeat protein